MGCVLSRSSRKKVGYHWAVQEKGGTGVGWAEGEKEREEVGEEVEEGEEEDNGGAVAAALTEAAPAALLLGVAQTTPTLFPCAAGDCCVPWGPAGARRVWKWPRVKVDVADVEKVEVEEFVVAADCAPWRRARARMAFSFCYCRLSRRAPKLVR